VIAKRIKVAREIARFDLAEIVSGGLDDQPLHRLPPAAVPPVPPGEEPSERRSTALHRHLAPPGGLRFLAASRAQTLNQPQVKETKGDGGRNGRSPSDAGSCRPRKRPCFAGPSPVARPGLEPGTPRFSVVAWRALSGQKALQTSGFCVRAAWEQKVAICELPRPKCGMRWASSHICRGALEPGGASCVDGLRRPALPLLLIQPGALFTT
jgi:hypothetical protein